MKYLLLLIFSLNISNTFAQDYECATKDYDESNIQLFIDGISKVNQTDFTGKFPIVNIPVQIHLFQTSSGTATVTLTQIRNEIASVNTKYANAGLKLVECLAPEIIKDDAFYNYNISQESYVLTNFYTPNLINLYFPNQINVTSSSTVCGYAQMPPNADYVFIAASCATNGSTFAHELGHYFGLPHTHSKWQNIGELVNGSNCSNAGDKFCDTPADPDLSNKVNSSCVYTGTAKDANNQSYNPNTRLMMSYSTFACRNSFSPAQYSMINYIYLNYRNYLNCGGTTSINTAEKANKTTIYPNPASDFLKLELNESQIASIKIFDTQGRFVYQSNEILNEDKIDISNFDNGYYIIQIKTNGITENKAFIVNH